MQLKKAKSWLQFRIFRDSDKWQMALEMPLKVVILKKRWIKSDIMKLQMSLYQLARVPRPVASNLCWGTIQICNALQRHAVSISWLFFSWRLYEHLLIYPLHTWSISITAVSPLHYVTVFVYNGVSFNHVSSHVHQHRDNNVTSVKKQLK